MCIIKNKLDHINLTVPDIEESIKFYTSVMKCDLMGRYKKSGLEFAFLSDDHITYELMEDSRTDSTVIDHIAYRSEDIESDFNYYKNLNLISTNIGYVDFIFEKGVYYFFIKGPGNEKIEFCQKKG